MADSQSAANHFDVLIIGTGAGGSACAYRLAQAGKRVLLLEKGGDLPDDGSTYDARIVVNGGFNSKEPWLDKDGKTFFPEEHFNVGGKTRWYGAALLRPGAESFTAEPDLSLMGWPIPYAEMVPYFEQAESLLEVRTYATEDNLKRMVPYFEQHGWKTAPMPLGIAEGIHDDPVQQTHWDGYALPDAWKSEACFHLLDPILQTGTVTLLKHAEVVALLPKSRSTEIAGVRCKDGRDFFADSVVLAAGALHSPRLLERYFADSGLSKILPAAAHVGRNFKRHILSAVMGFSLRKKTDLMSKTCVWTHEQFPHSTVQPLGGWADVEAVRQVMRLLPSALTELFALRSYGFFLQTEDSSMEENRVRAESDGGKPTLDYAVERMPALQHEHHAMRAGFRRALLSAGFINFTQSIPLSGLAHCAGTLTMGLDASHSVVDGHGRVHGMDNLYVADASVLPRLSKMNPSLTIYAWGLRLGDTLVRRERSTADQGGADVPVSG